MSEKTTWIQKTAHHFALSHGGHHLDVRYEAAGFESAWAVYAGGRLIDRCADFMQARGVALDFAARGA